MQWGIMGPGAVESTRRTRTLGLLSSTRQFNERAVPGLAGVWFGKQLLLGTLGVLVADRAQALGLKVSKILVTNAVEALACWLALSGNTAQEPTGKVRGRTKLENRSAGEMLFAKVSKPGFYVTQPMRMSIGASLPALGLVNATASRFNSFSCSPAGEDLINAAFEHIGQPRHRDVVSFLVGWVKGDTYSVDNDKLRAALSPLEPLSDRACLLLQERLLQGRGESDQWGRQRRSAALAWVRSVEQAGPRMGWDQQPSQISDAAHWADLRAGACFFAARDAAFKVLDTLETCMATPDNPYDLNAPLPERLVGPLSELRERAQAFLDLNHEDESANAFCRLVNQQQAQEILKDLVQLDGQVLRLRGNRICAGPAFEGGGSSVTIDEQSEEAAPASSPQWPEHISGRVANLWWLAQELDVAGRAS